MMSPAHCGGAFSFAGIAADLARVCGWSASACRNNIAAMRRTVVDLLVCLVIQILVLTGIGGAAHSGTMATAQSFALCGTGGVIDAPDGRDARHCLDCVAAVAAVEAGNVMAVPECCGAAAEPAPMTRRVDLAERAGALRIRAPPASSETDI